MDWFDDAVPPPPPRPKFLKVRLEELRDLLDIFFLGSDLAIKTYPPSPRFRHHQVDRAIPDSVVSPFFTHSRWTFTFEKKTFIPHISEAKIVKIAN